MKQLTVILAILMLLVSCEAERERNAFAYKEDFSLKIGHIETFARSETDCQTAYNPQKMEFRVQSDDMSDWYIVKLDRVPDKEDERIGASLTWTTYDGMGYKKNITLRVLRIEGDKVWLWEPNGPTGVVIRILE